MNAGLKKHCIKRPKASTSRIKVDFFERPSQISADWVVGQLASTSQFRHCLDFIAF
uniref:Uncharacterized protein n=1 Tax=Moniliophthora roreri TaxID=221103 RepID=A0A0W0GEE2_MONRR